MKSVIAPTLCIFAAAVTAGCLGSSPSIRQEVVGGSVAVPVQKSVAGNQQGSGGATRTKGLALGPTTGVGRSAAAGPTTEGVTRDVSRVNLRYMVEQPPPMPESKPSYRTPTRPAREAIWIEGYWAYTGNPNAPYEWMSGHWEIPPPGARSWVPSGWQRAGKNYVFVRGGWR
jgi:hypothetical protein